MPSTPSGARNRLTKLTTTRCPEDLLWSPLPASLSTPLHSLQPRRLPALEHFSPARSTSAALLLPARRQLFGQLPSLELFQPIGAR